MSRKALWYAKRIFNWAMKFRGSDDFKKVIAFKVSRGRTPLSVFFEGKIEGWGHDLRVDSDGLYWYRFGPGGHQELVASPQQLVRDLSLEFLKRAYSVIRKGDWERNLKLQKERILNFEKRFKS